MASEDKLNLTFMHGLPKAKNEYLYTEYVPIYCDKVLKLFKGHTYMLETRDQIFKHVNKSAVLQLYSVLLVVA